MCLDKPIKNSRQAEFLRNNSAILSMVNNRWFRYHHVSCLFVWMTQTRYFNLEYLEHAHPHPHPYRDLLTDRLTHIWSIFRGKLSLLRHLYRVMVMKEVTMTPRPTTPTTQTQTRYSNLEYSRELPSASLSEICVLKSLSKKADKQNFLGTTWQI